MNIWKTVKIFLMKRCKKRLNVKLKRRMRGPQTLSHDIFALYIYNQNFVNMLIIWYNLNHLLYNKMSKLKEIYVIEFPKI